MIALLFALFTLAMLLALRENLLPAHAVFALALGLGLFWFNHHMSSSLSIQL
ncbi:MAG TPA: DUF5993 family protein [Amaricoccus sp.]|uniref:DUF5993 family protein n=1 Tax=Amaricoccus sp. TaxID=1872485 RepID=UPI002BC59E9F|nr:DUF5993 family protein [Amaricoccus sp.]HMQ92203.1 DUF5993 family protein [Amaricoccus sp.]HMR52624.1 DUF5993 family protein [Amaricoccus sp.]HMR59620.1 DUF5993 family protein [Amaricoccus sp.]HMT99604.1 DUF5993 family protein [Amaricoccus sp.]